VESVPVRATTGPWLSDGGFRRSDSCTSTAWLWTLHADAHDFRSQTSDISTISRRIFASHFGHLALVFLWLSGMYFSGARFSNFEAWLTDPQHVRPSSQIAWAVFNQDIVNGDVGGGLSAVRVTSGFFQLWRAAGITSESQLSVADGRSSPSLSHRGPVPRCRSPLRYTVWRRDNSFSTLAGPPCHACPVMARAAGTEPRRGWKPVSCSRPHLLGLGPYLLAERPSLQR
jgi:Photosystem I psaA/psaB protein